MVTSPVHFSWVWYKIWVNIPTYTVCFADKIFLLLVNPYMLCHSSHTPQNYLWATFCPTRHHGCVMQVLHFLAYCSFKIILRLVTMFTLRLCLLVYSFLKLWTNLITTPFSLKLDKIEPRFKTCTEIINLGYIISVYYSGYNTIPQTTYFVHVCVCMCWAHTVHMHVEVRGWGYVSYSITFCLRQILPTEPRASRHLLWTASPCIPGLCLPKVRITCGSLHMPRAYKDARIHTPGFFPCTTSALTCWSVS